MGFKDQIWSQIEGGPVEKDRRRGRGREEEEKEEGEPSQKGMELWILYGSHGILRLVMVNSLFPKLGF